MLWHAPSEENSLLKKLVGHVYLIDVRDGKILPEDRYERQTT